MGTGDGHLIGAVIFLTFPVWLPIVFALLDPILDGPVPNAAAAEFVWELRQQGTLAQRKEAARIAYEKEQAPVRAREARRSLQAAQEEAQRRREWELAEQRRQAEQRALERVAEQKLDRLRAAARGQHI